MNEFRKSLESKSELELILMEAKYRHWFSDEVWYEAKNKISSFQCNQCPFCVDSRTQALEKYPDEGWKLKCVMGEIHSRNIDVNQSINKLLNMIK